MTLRRCRLLTIWPIVGLLIAQSACAMHPSHLLPPSEQVRAQLGTVGISSRSAVAEAALEGPTSGKVAGAAKGAGLGAGYTLLGGLQAAAIFGGPSGVVVLALAIGLAPVAALVGGIYGAIAAEPAEKMKEAGAALKKIAADLKVHDAIRDRVLQVARERTSHRFVPLAERPSLTDARVDTILEVSVPFLGLAGPTAVNPPLSLVIHACSRLIRAADGVEIYPSGSEDPRALAYASVPRKFLEWGAEDARLFREEMELAHQNLAEKIVEHVFLVHVPPGPRWTSAAGPARQTVACPPASVEVSR